MALQLHLAVSWQVSNAQALKKIQREKERRPPFPLIICGAGITQAGATGAYKDLCAGKGNRLQPRNVGEAHSHGAPNPAPRKFAPVAGSGPPDAPGLQDGGSLAALGLGRFARSGKAVNLSSLLASPHPGRTCPCRNSPTETTELKREACSLGAIA